MRTLGLDETEQEFFRSLDRIRAMDSVAKRSVLGL
jgi:hypothetical protein